MKNLAFKIGIFLATFSALSKAAFLQEAPLLQNGDARFSAPQNFQAKKFLQKKQSVFQSPLAFSENSAPLQTAPSFAASHDSQKAAAHTFSPSAEDFQKSALPKKNAISDEIFAILFEQGFLVQKSPLSNATSENFPYNVQVDFLARESEGPQSEDFFVCVSQEDFFRKKDFFLELLRFSQNNEFECNIKFLFTAGDERKIAGNEKTSGTQIFCSQMEGSQNTRALILSFSAQKNNFVSAGGGTKNGGTVSPLYLVKGLCSALEQNQLSFTLEGGVFLCLHNLGVLKSDSRLSAFLEREIPCVMLSLLLSEDEKKPLSAIKDFLLNAHLAQGAQWSCHYVPVKIFSRRFWISEEQTLFWIMLFTMLCLLVLSDFNFLFRRRSRRLSKIKKRALLSNYLIFVTAAILAISLFLGQTIANAFQKNGVKNFPLLFTIKISLPFFVVTLLYPLEIRIHKNLPPYIYEYILSVSALLNVFIFSAMEITLFFLFALEYAILAASRAVKRTAFLYVFMAAFLIPFLPLAHSILLYSDPQKISELIFCSIWKNFFLAFAFVPLSLLWLRVLARLNLKAKSAKKTAAFYFIFFAISLAAIASVSAIAIFVFEKIFFRYAETPPQFLKIEDAAFNENAKVRIYDSKYYGGKIRRVEISCEQEAERYAVFAKGENPVYFSLYESEEKNGGEEFLLPENPPKNLTISYTPSYAENSKIKVEAYFLKNDFCLRETFFFEEVDGEFAQKFSESENDF